MIQEHRFIRRVLDSELILDLISRVEREYIGCSSNRCSFSISLSTEDDKQHYFSDLSSLEKSGLLKSSGLKAFRIGFHDPVADNLILIDVKEKKFVISLMKSELPGVLHVQSTDATWRARVFNDLFDILDRAPKQDSFPSNYFWGSAFFRYGLLLYFLATFFRVDYHQNRELNLALLQLGSLIIVGLIVSLIFHFRVLWSGIPKMYPLLEIVTGITVTERTKQKQTRLIIYITWDLIITGLMVILYLL